MARDLILSLDQGTTSTRAVIYDLNLVQIAESSQPLEQQYPAPAWVEHDPVEIYEAARTVIADVLKQVAPDIPRAMGITNQRETVIAWSKSTGVPVHNALVWQDRRTATFCNELRESGFEPVVANRTGLLLDPYFSASKIRWLLDNVPDARDQAEKGELLVGTVDTWLIWKLTGGRVHATDATNASRTQLYNIHTGHWDGVLLALFGVSAQILPVVRATQENFGITDKTVTGAEIPIAGVVGDQQSAAYGQACFSGGDIKATFGTGCFVLVNTNTQPVLSQNRLLTTILNRIEGRKLYALEGSVFMAGATIQWLLDNLGIIESAKETEALAREADPDSGVHLVPAFQGLGAPQWDSDARGLICGLSRKAGRAEIVRAALEGVAWQTYDLMSAIAADMTAAGIDPPTRLRVDGGMARNDWFLQFLADILNIPVDRSGHLEATALGAACHAGLRVGLIENENALSAFWQADKTFTPKMHDKERQRRLNGWQEAVSRTTSSKDHLS